MMELKKGDRIDVYWLDADNDSGWLPHDEAADNLDECLVSTGRLVSKGPKFITLSFCHNALADEWLGKHRIPVGMVVEIKKLREEEDASV